MAVDLMKRYPAIGDLWQHAQKRMPHFAWEFVESGTGDDACVRRNREALAALRLVPQFMKGVFEPDIKTRLFGIDYNAPFGVSPVGLSGLAWPQTEQILARSAAKYRLPFALSTFSNETPELIGQLADGMAWFQLYPPRNSNIRNDLLARASDAGFSTLLITADVPIASRRERQRRAGLGVRTQPKLTTRLIYECIKRPAWSLATLREGKPRFRGLEKYVSAADAQQFLDFVSRELGGSLDWEYLRAVRDEWRGPLVLKGTLDVAEAKQAMAIGVDGILVSNHGGRQFDAAPASVTALPAIKQAVGDRVKVLLDSGVYSGIDIARAIALGADFVLLGRAFIFAVAALGRRGGDHAMQLLSDDLKNNMSQLGCSNLAQLRERLDKANA